MEKADETPALRRLPGVYTVDTEVHVELSCWGWMVWGRTKRMGGVEWLLGACRDRGGVSREERVASLLGCAETWQGTVVCIFPSPTLALPGTPTAAAAWAPKLPTQFSFWPWTLHSPHSRGQQTPWQPVDP